MYHYRSLAVTTIPIGYLFYTTCHSKSYCDKNEENLYVFGSNAAGQLATASSRDSFIPTKISVVNPKDVSLLECSSQNTACALNSGALARFGRSLRGSNIKDQVSFPQGIKSLGLGYHHGGLVDGNGDIFTWGNNVSLQLGRKTDDWKGDDKPEMVKSNIKFSKISCGGNFTAAISQDDGILYTWGSGRDGAVGHGIVTSISEPKPIDPSMFGGEKIKQVCGGRESLLMLTESGNVYSCGSSDFGKLGLGKTENRNISTPQKIESLKNVTFISQGDFHAAAVTEDKKVFTWGKGDFGSLGTGHSNDEWSPVELTYLQDKNISQVFCGGNHSAALSENGELYLWGKGRSGQLGQGGEIASVAAYRTTPIEYMEHKVSLVCLGGDHTVLLASENKKSLLKKRSAIEINWLN